MPQETIFLPVLAMAALTFFVLMFIPLRRFRAVFARDLTPDDFALGESDRVSAHVALANRNYMNLLEMPVLFYAVCVAMFVTGTVDSLAVNLAWVYVALRVAHSLVHLSFNHVITRVSLFAASNFAVIALWVVFGARIWERAAG